jgi:hypothetical protein
MKRQHILYAIGILLLSEIFIFSACKKKSTETVSNPSFTLSATPDPNNAENLVFYLDCTTDNVKMTRIDIKDPLNSGITPIDMQSANMLKGTIYELDESFTKELGTWTFTFTGNRISDNSAFVSTATLNVSGK